MNLLTKNRSKKKEKKKHEYDRNNHQERGLKTFNESRLLNKQQNYIPNGQKR